MGWSRVGFAMKYVMILVLASTIGFGTNSGAEEDARLPRVLLIGDSISIGYTAPTRELLKEVAEVRRVKGNAGHTGMGLARLDRWLDRSLGSWDVIHFNWGLWDLCYRHPDSKTQGKRDKARGKLTHTPAEYEANLRKIVKRLKQTGAQLIWAATTPVPEGEAGRKVGDDIVYNQVALKVMKENGIMINDLHTLIAPDMAELAIRPGDVHFKKKGYEVLATAVSDSIRKALASREAKPANSR